MRTKLAGFLAAVALVVAGGYFVSQDVNGQRQVLMTVVWNEVPGSWVQVQFWENAEPSKVYRPSNGRWVERITVAPGTPVLLRGLLRHEGQMSCLIQVIGGSQDRDPRVGPGEVECKVYA